MILDSIKNAELYYSLSPRIAQALEYIKSTDFNKLEVGRHDVDDDNIFVNIMERELKNASDAKLEVHNNYIDIQVVISDSEEGFGYAERCSMQHPTEEFNAVKDIQFFDDEPQTTYFVRKGQFTILFPEDAHAPLIGKGAVKKAVVKVKL